MSPVGVQGESVASETDGLPGADVLTRVRVRQQPLSTLPTDLYIPPDALEVFLDAFEGPLDLLLYLIRRHDFDILDIPIAAVTEQYMRYVELIGAVKLELAADYLLMAALLAEIKSRMLLPPVASEEGDADADPRAELVRRLQEYERYRQAAQDLDARPRVGRDLFVAVVAAVRPAEVALPEVRLEELVQAMIQALARAEIGAHHRVRAEVLSVRERMAWVLECVQGHGDLAFEALLKPGEGAAGVVVSFLAVLELLKAHAVDLVQDSPYGPIRVRDAASAGGTDQRRRPA